MGRLTPDDRHRLPRPPDHRSRPTWERRRPQADRGGRPLGIDQLCCSILTPRRPATAEGFRECNRWVAEAMKRFPGRVLGYCYVNPGHQREALEEIRRCVRDHGFIGVKLYNEYRCTDPVVFPIVELAIELGVPILHHAGHLPLLPRRSSRTSPTAATSRSWPAATPRPSSSAPTSAAAATGSGRSRRLRHAPSVYLDTSGSVTDDGVVEMAAQGPRRRPAPLRLRHVDDRRRVGRIRGGRPRRARRRRRSWAGTWRRS